MVERNIFALDIESLAALQSAIGGRVSGGTGGGSGGMEARIAKLESDVSHIQSDIREIKADLRTVLRAMAGGVVLLATMLIVGYFRLSDQIAQPMHVTVTAPPAAQSPPK